jgi:hypothetical protein
MASSLNIQPNVKTKNGFDSHQVSPAYVLTFVRWEGRDLRDSSGSSLETRDPMVVINDAVNITLNSQKNSRTSSVSIDLLCGDINYATAVAPGDYVLVNLLDWEKDAMVVYNKALNQKPINSISDGFKGIFKIMTVTKNLVTAPDGHKMFSCNVTAMSFTELDTAYLYNPLIDGALQAGSKAFFVALVGQMYSDLLKSDSKCQEIIKSLFEILLGKSVRSNNEKGVDYGDTHYKLPNNFGKLIGRDSASYMNEMYNLVIGIWSNGDTSNLSTAPIHKQLNPSITKISKKSNMYQTPNEIQGNKLLSVENWNQKTVWSILNENLNQVLNEMYVTYRPDPESGLIYPTLVIRQKPFNNPDFKSSFGSNFTYFTSLPRWRIDPAMVFSYQMTKNQHLDFNFVQVYTRGLASSSAGDVTRQIQEMNFISNRSSIERGGMRPYIMSSNFDFPVGGNKRIRAKEWTELVADWVINGHLKESGVINCVGLQEPIAVGDNLEFDNVLYHIEGVSHVFHIHHDGKKEFKTSLTVSYGIDMKSNSDQLLFTEMQYTDRYTKSLDDYKNNKILPGFSDTQDIKGRSKGEEINNTREKTFQAIKRKK